MMARVSLRATVIVGTVVICPPRVRKRLRSSAVKHVTIGLPRARLPVREEKGATTLSKDLRRVA